ncbi:peptide-methionine (R)-S-oxide reductase MsrB [Planctomicrobium sp. SH527]|uniref:peptide-methionine (R)-S-oxide reductase MsrB n=1 Tax=Planctomicrobium sp. SH527 TaxID=3448123 RepID=UPI003F5BEEA3
MSDKIHLSEEEWKKRLNPAQYYVLRQKGTEPPFQNEFDEHFEPGTYTCAACGTELFDSDTKFNSGCGWPAFYLAKAEDRITRVVDTSHGRIRTEVLCSKCDSHLGHVFEDAPQTPTGERYCINSVAILFHPKEQ